MLVPVPVGSRSGKPVVRARAGPSFLAVPLVIDPRGVGRIGPTLVVAAIPLRIPLHHDLVVGIRRVAEVGAIEVPVNAVGETVDNTRGLVVSVLVKTSCGYG